MKIPSNRVYSTKEETIEGWREWKGGSQKAFDKLQCTACKIALAAAQEYLDNITRRGEEKLTNEDREDCEQEAVMSALEVLKRWDPAEGHLSTLVMPRAEGAIRNWLDTNSNSGMASRKTPYAVNVDSSDQDAEGDYDDDGEEYYGSQSHGDDYAPSPEDILIAKEEKALRKLAVSGALETLPQQDREIITRYYGIGREAETQKAIADSLGISREAITQRVGRIQRILKNTLGSLTL